MTLYGFCCTSSKYIKPLQYGDICLNGGNALGQKCQKAEECQQRQQNVGNVNTGSLFCIDDECCTQQQQFPSQPNQNQRNVVKPNLDDKQIIANKCPYGIFTGKYCSSSDECGSPSTTFCYQGICCSTASKPDTGLDDFSRGTATCSVYNYKYFNRHCATPLNCGFQTDNFLCISGYCCAKYNSPIGPKGFCSEDERFNRFMGQKCNVDSDCLPSYDPKSGAQLRIKCFGNQCCGEDLYGISGQKFDQPGLTVNIQAICFDGTSSNQPCNSPNDCGNAQKTCVNNICCQKDNNFDQYACGGLQSIGHCDTKGLCSVGECVSAEVCCECPFGQPQKNLYNCKEGSCEKGYFCSRSGFCCPQCQNGKIPRGSCYKGQCGAGTICQPGNICCEGIV
ncbi:hypothetical protein ACQ4LE_000303 [Meloidogyne hapla]